MGYVSIPLKEDSKGGCEEKPLRGCKLIESNLGDEDQKPLWSLGESLKLMSRADLVVFAPDWEDARGCRIEYMCASEYEVPILVAAQRLRG